MRHIWLTLAAFFVLGPLLGGALAAAEEKPAATSEDHVLGKPDAPVTIIEYASLTCPHCAEFDRDTLPKIKADWIDTGKAKLVFRIFPLNGLDLRAAVLADCAPPERYFAFVDELYRSQDTWARAGDPEQALANIGRLGGVSEDKFKSCLADKKRVDAIAAQGFTAQKAYGVDSTPTFFINGVKPDKNGALPYEAFNQLLTAALPKT